MQNILQRYRYSFVLLRQLVKTDFKLRYQGSILGYLWSLLRPLALFLILYVVFVRFLRFGSDIPHFPIYLLIGIVLWNFFIEVTTGSVAAIVGKGDLLRKLNFPKYVLILAGSFSALINLALNSVVILIFMVINHVEFRAIGLLFPIFIAELFIFALAIGFFLSAAYVRYRDVNYIWEVITQGAFYATPIIYPLSLVPVEAAKILMLNPVAQIIQDIRFVLVTNQTQTIDDFYGGHWIRIVPVIMALLLVVIAATYFRRRSKYFAEEV
jgi:ABC-2 type transport system permease protein